MKLTSDNLQPSGLGNKIYHGDLTPQFVKKTPTTLWISRVSVLKGFCGLHLLHHAVGLNALAVLQGLLLAVLH